MIGRLLNRIKFRSDPIEFLMKINRLTRTDLQLRKTFVTDTFKMSNKELEELHRIVHKILERLLGEKELKKAVNCEGGIVNYSVEDAYRTTLPIQIVSERYFYYLVWRYKTHKIIADNHLIGMAECSAGLVIHIDRSLFAIQNVSF